MDWFPGWLAYHLRVAHHDLLPKPAVQKETARDFFGVWKAEFERLKVMEDEARAASDKLAARGGAFPNQHLNLLTGFILGARTDARLAAEAALRRRQSEEHTRRVDEHARLKQRWAAMPEEEREAIREEVRKEVPEVAEFESMISWHCIEKLRAKGVPAK